MGVSMHEDYTERGFMVDEGNLTTDDVVDNDDDNTSNYYYTQDEDTNTSSSNFIILHHLIVKIVTSVILAVYLIGLILLVIIKYAVNKEVQRTRQKMANGKRNNLENKSSLHIKNNPDSRSLLEKILEFSSSSITLFLCWFTIYLIFFPILIPCTVVLFVVRVGVFLIVKVLLRKKLHWGSGNDTIWGSEETAQTSIMTALYILENEPDLEKIRKNFTENVINRKQVQLFENQDAGYGEKINVNYEKFKWSLKNYGGFFYWEEFDNFSIEDHIKSVPQSIQDEADVFDELSQLSHQPFESKYPPWEILVSNFKYEEDADGDNDSSSNFNTPQVNFNRKYVRNKAGGSKPNNAAHYSSGKFSLSKIKSSPSPSPSSKSHATTTTNSSISKKSHYALILRFHHSLLDGISAGLIFNYLVADKPAILSVNPLKFSTTNRENTKENNSNCIPTFFKLLYYYSAALILSPLILVENFTRTNKIHSLHKATQVTGPKFFTWLKPIPLEDLKEIKKLTGANITSIFMSALGNTVSDILTNEVSVKFDMESDSLNKITTTVKRKSDHFKDIPNSVTIAQTAALLPYKDMNPTNRFSIVMTPVQLNKVNTSTTKLIDSENELNGTELEILSRVQRDSTSTFGIASVLVNFYSMKLMGYLPLVAIKFLSKRVDATLTCSNIPGPVAEISAFQGDVVKDLVFWAPMKNRTAIGVNFFSYAGNVRIGIVADYTVFQDVHQVNNFAKILHEQIYKLLRVARNMSKLKDNV